MTYTLAGDCPGCDQPLDAKQFCERCECFGWEHGSTTLEQMNALIAQGLWREPHSELRRNGTTGEWM